MRERLQTPTNKKERKRERYERLQTPTNEKERKKKKRKKVDFFQNWGE